MSNDPYLDYLQRKGLEDAKAREREKKAEADAKWERKYKIRGEIRSAITLIISSFAFILSIFSLFL